MTSKNSDTGKKDLIVSLGSINCSRLCDDCVIIGYVWFSWRALIVKQIKTTANIKAPPLELCDACFAHVSELIFLNAINIVDDDTDTTSGDTTPTTSPRGDTTTTSPRGDPTSTTVASTSAHSATSSQRAQERSPSLPRCPKVIRQPSSTPPPPASLDHRIHYPADHPSRLHRSFSSRRDRSRSPRRSSTPDQPHRRERVLDYCRDYNTSADQVRHYAKNREEAHSARR